MQTESSGSKMMHASHKSDYGSNWALTGSGWGLKKRWSIPTQNQTVRHPFCSSDGATTGSCGAQRWSIPTKNQMVRHSLRSSDGGSKMMHAPLRDQMLRLSCLRWGYAGVSGRGFLLKINDDACTSLRSNVKPLAPHLEMLGSGGGSLMMRASRFQTLR